MKILVFLKNIRYYDNAFAMASFDAIGTIFFLGNIVHSYFRYTEKKVWAL